MNEKISPELSYAIKDAHKTGLVDGIVLSTIFSIGFTVIGVFIGMALANL
jgi:hypothetical protein